MRDIIVEGSRLILTTQGFLTRTQSMVHNHFSIQPQLECSHHGQELNPQTRAPQQNAIAT